MSEKQNLPLQSLFEPLMVMFKQVESYESLFEELEIRQKEQRKNKFVIEKLIAMQDKKQQLEKEKIEFDSLYQKFHLTREQHKHLISLDIDVDKEFYQIYKILDEQENLALELEKSGPSPLRGSLTENIDIIRQAALSKIIAHLKKHFENITIEELLQINSLFPNQVNEQIIFVLRFKFSNHIVPLLAGLNSQDDQSIKNFFKTFNSEIQQTYQYADQIFGDNVQAFYPQIIDNICCDYVQQLDATIKFVESYFLIFEISNEISSIIHNLEASKSNLTCLSGFQKLFQLCQQLKTKNIALMTHNLQIIRFNIASFSSYQPLKDQLDQIQEFIKKNKKEERAEVFRSLWQPFQQLVQMKLQQNAYNRSSKIFSINALQIFIERLEGFEFEEILEIVLQNKKECETLLQDLMQKLKQENVQESASKFKLQQREKNSQISKDQFKKYLRQIVLLDENGFRNDLFFEIDLIVNEQLKGKIQLELAETFTKEYYEPLYENLQKFSQQNEFTTEVIQQLCQQYSVTTKDIHRIPVYIRDPGAYKLNLLNFQSL